MIELLLLNLASICLLNIFANLCKLFFKIRNIAIKIKSLKYILYKKIDKKTKVKKFEKYVNYNHNYIFKIF